MLATAGDAKARKPNAVESRALPIALFFLECDES